METWKSKKSKHSLSLRVIPAALTLLFSSFGMAGETFTYNGSNPKLKMDVTFHDGSSTTEVNNVLSPTGSVSDNKTSNNNNIIITMM